MNCTCLTRAPCETCGDRVCSLNYKNVIPLPSWCRLLKEVFAPQTTGCQRHRAAHVSASTTPLFKLAIPMSHSCPQQWDFLRHSEGHHVHAVLGQEDLEAPHLN